VLELVSKFVPAADEVHRLQTGSDPDCRLFQKFCDQGHYGSRPGTRQGTYCAAPSGVFLASVNSNDPVQIAKMLERALAKWEKLTADQRLLSADPAAQTAAVKRAERNYPHDGLVLHVFSRDLPRDNPGAGWRATAWNQDYAWFTKKEVRRLLPEKLEVGQSKELPKALMDRLACAHLVDNVRGQTVPYEEKDVKKARLVLQVTAVQGGVVTLRLEGEAHLAAEGKWPVQGARKQQKALQKRGFEARILGQATYDLSKERFSTFDLLALGDRWGASQFNVRRGDTDTAPLGILFTLAGDRPSERVAPAFHYHRSYRLEN
jgi:hypothetical protein